LLKKLIPGGGGGGGGGLGGKGRGSPPPEPEQTKPLELIQKLCDNKLPARHTRRHELIVRKQLFFITFPPELMND